MNSAIEMAVRMITEQRGIHGEIIQKKWPAEGIIYVRLCNDAGGEEWTLMDPGSDYDKAYVVLQRAANRLLRGNGNGV